MTDIVSTTGTYHWYYSHYYVPYSGTYVSGAPYVPPFAISDMSSATETYTLAQIVAKVNSGTYNNGAGGVEIVNTGSFAGTVAPPNGITGFGGGQLIATGAVYDTGTVQIYAYYCDVTAYTNNNPTINFVVYRHWIWVYYAPQLPPDPPVSVATPVTLDLSKLDPNNYFPKPGQESILPKYVNGVNLIRGTFQSGTRTAVIRGNNLGGFIIYEEVAGVPSGNCYVYDFNRTLKDVVLPSGLDQYTS